MNITLTVVVAAIVILITALVVITIFGTTITRFSSITDATQNCDNIGRTSCATTGQLPFNWQSKFQVNKDFTTCQTLESCSDCSDCEFPTPS